LVAHVIVFYSMHLIGFTCPYVVPQLPKIQSVVVTPGYAGMSPNANPSLEVTWSAVDDPTVSYVVRYSQSVGTITAPPDGASEVSVNGNSVTLSANLAPEKRSTFTYYIWVAATSGGVTMGEYSDRASGVTLNSEQYINLMSDNSVHSRHICVPVS